MDLTPQFLDDFRAIERKAAQLERENADLRRQQEDIEESARLRWAGRLEELRSESARLREENSTLRGQVALWRRKHDDLARES